MPTRAPHRLNLARLKAIRYPHQAGPEDGEPARGQSSRNIGDYRPSSAILANHAPRRILALPERRCRLARYERTARSHRRPQGARNAPGRPSGFDSTGIPYPESVPRAGESGRDCRKISRLRLFALRRQTGNRAEKGSLTPRNGGSGARRPLWRVWEGSGIGASGSGRLARMFDSGLVATRLG